MTKNELSELFIPPDRGILESIDTFDDNEEGNELRNKGLVCKADTTRKIVYGKWK